MDSRVPNCPPYGLFVTGTDTGVGKTLVARALVEWFRAANVAVGAYKPAASGAERSSGGQFRWDDVEQLATSLVRFGDSVTDELRQRICPQRFQAHLAPPLAARMESRVVDDNLLGSGASEWHGHCDVLIVEGAGGWLSPLSDLRDNADLAAELGYPVVLVARAGLGTINHTRLTVDAIRNRGTDVGAVLLVESRAATDDISMPGNFTALSARFSDIPVQYLPHVANRDLRNQLASLKIDWLSVARRGR